MSKYVVQHYILLITTGELNKIFKRSGAYYLFIYLFYPFLPYITST